MSPKKKSEYAVSKLKEFSAAALAKAAENLLSALEAESKVVDSGAEWKVFRDRWMARKNGILTQVNDLWLKAAPKEAKREVGQRVNLIKGQVEQAVKVVEDRLIAEVENTLDDNKIARVDSVDVTLPGIRRPLGAEHPVIKTMNEMVWVFRNLV